jgi:hypothetical protein
VTYPDLFAIECRYRIQELLAEADRDGLASQCFDHRADRRSKHAVRRLAIGLIATTNALLVAVAHAPAAPASDLTSTTTPAMAAAVAP